MPERPVERVLRETLEDIRPAGAALQETESSPPCPLFTLSARITGTGHISTLAVDMEIQVIGTGAGGIHQYQLEVRSAPPHYTSPISLEFEWYDVPGWTPNGIIRPTVSPATIQTNSSPLFQAKVRKIEGGQIGLQPVTTEFRHGMLSPQCVHKVSLKVLVI